MSGIGHKKRVHKFAGSEFKRTKCGPKGEIQDVFRNPAGPAINIYRAHIVGFGFFDCKRRFAINLHNVSTIL